MKHSVKVSVGTDPSGDFSARVNNTQALSMGAATKLAAHAEMTGFPGEEIAQKQKNIKTETLIYFWMEN